MSLGLACYVLWSFGLTVHVFHSEFILNSTKEVV